MGGVLAVLVGRSVLHEERPRPLVSRAGHQGDDRCRRDPAIPHRGLSPSRPQHRTLASGPRTRAPRSWAGVRHLGPDTHRTQLGHADDAEGPARTGEERALPPGAPPDLLGRRWSLSSAPQWRLPGCGSSQQPSPPSTSSTAPQSRSVTWPPSSPMPTRPTSARPRCSYLLSSDAPHTYPADLDRAYAKTSGTITPARRRRQRAVARGRPGLWQVLPGNPAPALRCSVRRSKTFTRRSPTSRPSSRMSATRASAALRKALNTADAV